MRDHLRARHPELRVGATPELGDVLDNLPRHNRAGDSERIALTARATPTR